MKWLKIIQQLAGCEWGKREGVDMIKFFIPLSMKREMILDIKKSLVFFRPLSDDELVRGCENYLIIGGHQVVFVDWVDEPTCFIGTAFTVKDDQVNK